jgi:hypothetical protein
VCPVKAAEWYQKQCPSRFTGVERDMPMARWDDGSPVTRGQIQRQLEEAAAQEGYPADRMRSHSLRIGGATALYQVYGDTELVKRWGRWASGAFHAYLWESNAQAKGVARSMAGTTTTLHVGYTEDDRLRGSLRRTAQDRATSGRARSATSATRFPERRVRFEHGA